MSRSLQNLSRVVVAATLATVAPAALAQEGPASEHAFAVEELTEEEWTPDKHGYHGFRVGYTYINTTIEPRDTLRSPHLFNIGYEFTQRMLGDGDLHVITVENLVVSGLNQSLFIPSANALVGFEFKDDVQIGVGANLAPFDPTGNFAHMIVAVGVTPDLGGFHVPLHVSYVPDVDGAFRVAITTGANW